MIKKKITYGSETRDKLLRGISKFAKTVGVTLGPKGRNVLIEKNFGAPKSTKDGVTVAKEIELEDRIENLGVSVLKEAASKSNDRAGDGTTTTTVLAYAIAIEGIKAVTAGMNPMDIKRGMIKAKEIVINEIKSFSKSISSSNEIAQVATISANGDRDIGEKISKAFEKVGKNGIITVEEVSKSDEFEVEVVEGMNFDRGFLSAYFVNNSEKMVCEFDNPYIMIFEKKISSIQQILPLLENITQSLKPLLIIAEDVEGEALATLIVNKLRGGIKVCAVKSPGFGDRKRLIIEDISILTGAQFISEDLGHKIENIKLNDLGIARKVVISKDETTIIGGHGNKKEIEGRCYQIKSQIEETNSDYDREKLEERLAKLSGGIGILKVGGVTELEVKEKKDRVEDAYYATKAAIEEGIVPGGGCTLLYASRSLDNIRGNNRDEAAGIEIIKNALFSPALKILSNAGEKSELIIEKLLEKNNYSMIYDAQNQKIVCAFDKGIVDPTKVVRNAIQSSISVAALLVTTEAAIYENIKHNNVDKNATGMNAYNA